MWPRTSRPGLAILLLAFLAVPLAADEDVTSGIELDWFHAAGGVHRGDSLLPLRMLLENTTAEDRVLRLEGNWEGSPARVSRVVELAAGARKEVDLYLGPARATASFDIYLLDEDGEVLEEVLLSSVPVPSDRSVVALLTRHPMGWSTLEQRRDFDGKLVHLDPAALPRRAEGLRSFDIILWPDPRPEVMSAEIVEALRRWVATGGHLVLLVNDAGRHDISPWSGIRAVDTVFVRQLESLGAAIGTPAGPFAEPLAALALEPGTGRAWLDETWGTLGAEERRGQGSVTVLGFDPTDPRLADWDGLGRFWLRLLERRGVSAHRRDREDRRNRYLEPFDLRSAARAVLTDDTGGTPLPWKALGLILVAYLLIIGPGEYLLLKRLGRLKWTWFTFPCWVLAFSLLAYSVAAGSRSSQALLRHLLVRDLAPASDTFYEELHTSLFVPQGGEYRLAPRTAGAMPLVSAGFSPQTRYIYGGGNHFYYGRAEQPEIFAPTAHQGEGAITSRVAKWSFLAGTFLSRSPARGVRADLEIEPASYADTEPPWTVVPRLGHDLDGAWLLLSRQGRPVRLDLGPLRDGAPVSVEASTEDPVDPRKVFGYFQTDGMELEAFLDNLAVETIRDLLLRHPWETEDGKEQWLWETLYDDPHPHHDWSSVLEDGGAVLLAWAYDPESRLAPPGIDAAESGLVIYRVALPKPNRQDRR